MAEQNFKRGDVVQLPSGGPKMTVVETGGATIRCVWANDRGLHTADVPAGVLIEVTQDDMGGAVMAMQMTPVMQGAPPWMSGLGVAGGVPGGPQLATGQMTGVAGAVPVAAPPVGMGGAGGVGPPMPSPPGADQPAKPMTPKQTPPG
jgi:uncharacterized protein YodC (DUF2158 family)